MAEPPQVFVFGLDPLPTSALSLIFSAMSERLLRPLQKRSSLPEDDVYNCHTLVNLEKWMGW